MGDDNLSMAYDCKVETLGEDAVKDHMEALKTVLYPSCAVISYKPNREKCCNELVQSEAGRSYCYNDLIHQKGKFDRCLKNTAQDKITCCESSYRNQPEIIYDCQVDVLGLDFVTEYLLAKKRSEEAEQAKLDAEAAEKALKEAEAAAAAEEVERLRQEAEAAEKAAADAAAAEEEAKKAEEERNRVIVPEQITEPIDCLTQSAYFGALSGDVETTDMLHINKVSPVAVISSFRICTDNERRNVLGVQLFYARYIDGRLSNEFSMEKHGLTDENEIVSCQYNDFLEGEYMTGMGFGYTNKDLIQLVFKTNKGQLAAYGGQSPYIVQTPLITFDEDDVKFFGFNSRSGSTGQLTALSMIVYEAACMNEFIEDLGDEFDWTERNIPVKDPEADFDNTTPDVVPIPKPKPTPPPNPTIGPVNPTP